METPKIICKNCRHEIYLDFVWEALAGGGAGMFSHKVGRLIRTEDGTWRTLCANAEPLTKFDVINEFYGGTGI